MKSNQPENLSPAGTSLLNRRDFLSRSGTAFGGMALAGLLADDHLLGSPIRPKINPDPFPRARPISPPGPSKCLSFTAPEPSVTSTPGNTSPSLSVATTPPMPGAVNTFQGENGNLIRPLGISPPGALAGR